MDVGVIESGSISGVCRFDSGDVDLDILGSSEPLDDLNHKFMLGLVNPGRAEESGR